VTDRHVVRKRWVMLPADRHAGVTDMVQSYAPAPVNVARVSSYYVPSGGEQ
jgi:hypothetical protein